MVYALRRRPYLRPGPLGPQLGSVYPSHSAAMCAPLCSNFWQRAFRGLAFYGPSGLFRPTPAFSGCLVSSSWSSPTTLLALKLQIQGDRAAAKRSKNSWDFCFLQRFIKSKTTCLHYFTALASWQGRAVAPVRLPW